jgi:hypothetical protein
MPSFVVKDTVDELTYDFEPYGGKGTIPEPTSSQITMFQKSLSELMVDLVPAGFGDDITSNTNLVRRVTEYLSKDTSESQEKLLQAIADVCSDRPSFDELSRLPYRAQQAFSGWVTGTFLVSQLSTPATNG